MPTVDSAVDRHIRPNREAEVRLRNILSLHFGLTVYEGEYLLASRLTFAARL